MRVTRDRLLSLALKETERRAQRGDVLSGYVIGSLAAGDPLIAGTGDIDLVLIHDTTPWLEREFVPLSSEIHLDIAHRPRSFYQQPRELREHPWFGPEMCEPAFLYDPTHFFEWAQAAVRGQYYRPDFVHARAQAFLRRARESVLEALGDRSWLSRYLRALLETANAVASLTSFPAAGRQVGMQLAAKLDQAGHPELLERFQLLLGADLLPPRALPDWIAAWAREYDLAMSGGIESTNSEPASDRPDFDPSLTPERRDYFLAGYQSMVENGRGSLILWPLLANWERLPVGLAGHPDPWASVLEQLHLSPSFADQRTAALERLQDEVDRQLERWSERVGA